MLEFLKYFFGKGEIAEFTNFTLAHFAGSGAGNYRTVRGGIPALVLKGQKESKNRCDCKIIHSPSIFSVGNFGVMGKKC